MIKAVEAPLVPLRGARLWPLSVAAYRALGEAGLIPKNTELLYGCVYTKMSKSPFHSFLLQFLTETLRRMLREGRLLRVEQPISCGDSEPEPELAVVNGRNEDFRHDHPHTAELVIEVCLTSHDYDRSKLPAYAAAGVKAATGAAKHAMEGGGLMSLLGLGKIPVTITFSTITFFAWFATLFAAPRLDGFGFLPRLGVLMASLVASLQISSVVLRPA